MTICWTPATWVESAAAIIGTPRPLCSRRVPNSRMVRSILRIHAPQHSRAAREGRNHQAVPCSQDFIVEVRTWTLAASVEEHAPGAVQRVEDGVGAAARGFRNVCDRFRDVQQVLARELVLRIERCVSLALNPVTHSKQI